MINLQTIATPGVYINELNAFPNSVVAVPTAIPAFIGYTPQAVYQGKSYTNVPVMISSFSDFQAFFCLPNPAPPASPAKQYSPEYYLVPQKTQPVKGDFIQLNSTFYSILPDPNTIYYLYNSVRLFYQNGGGTAYIVSVGSYGASSGKPMNPGDPLINPNVQLNDLTKGLYTLLNEQDPTMYICPEATLLNPADNGTLMEEMLLQSSNMGTSVSIFDIINGNDPDPILYTNDIASFRANCGTTGLSYGAAYYPFLGTTLMQQSDIDYTNLFGGDLDQLAAIINPPSSPNPNVTAILANIKNPSSGLTVSQNNNSLVSASVNYSTIITHVLNDVNLMPPSGAIAGVITNIDNSIGPWQAPANVSIAGATAPLPINLSDSQQGNLNMDPVSGKSINVIRTFTGLGTLIWGARTLDGNSMDWKYLSVRRTLIFLEQSCKLAAHAYVFEPNSKNTWNAVVAMISGFLNTVWSQGGLQGATPADAYNVECGLGTTMNSVDLLNGFMNVTVKVAVVHPAEFIVLTFQQQQAVSG